MASFYDFGQVYQLAGVGGVTNSTKTSPAFNCGAAAFVKIKIVITTDATSTMTAVAVKAQGLWTDGGTDLSDMISYRLDNNASQPEVTHNYTGLTAGTTSTFFVKVLDHQGLKGGLVLGVTGTFSSGSAKAGDSVTISALGW